MFKKINSQFIVSYLGFFPFLTILFDKLFFKYLDPSTTRDFCVFYSIIIFVFIGAINWNLKKKISFYLLFLGLFPSIVSIFLIIMYLFSYEIIPYLFVFLLFQLVLDNFNYKEKKDRVVFYYLRVPLTISILVCLFFI